MLSKKNLSIFLVILPRQSHHEPPSISETNRPKSGVRRKWMTGCSCRSIPLVVDVFISLSLPGTRPCIRCQKWQQNRLQPEVKGHENNETLKWFVSNTEMGWYVRGCEHEYTPDNLWVQLAPGAVHCCKLQNLGLNNHLRWWHGP